MRLGVPACAVDSAVQGSGSLHWHTQLKAAPWDAPPPAAFTGKSAPPLSPWKQQAFAVPPPPPPLLPAVMPRISEDSGIRPLPLAPGQG